MESTRTRAQAHRNSDWCQLSATGIQLSTPKSIAPSSSTPTLAQGGAKGKEDSGDTFKEGTIWKSTVDISSEPIPTDIYDENSVWRFKPPVWRGNVINNLSLEFEIKSNDILEALNSTSKEIDRTNNDDSIVTITSLTPQEMSHFTRVQGLKEAARRSTVISTLMNRKNFAEWLCPTVHGPEKDIKNIPVPQHQVYSDISLIAFDTGLDGSESTRARTLTVPARILIKSRDVFLPIEEDSANVDHSEKSTKADQKSSIWGDVRSALGLGGSSAGPSNSDSTSAHNEEKEDPASNEKSEKHD